MSHRPYRPSLGINAAREEIAEKAASCTIPPLSTHVCRFSTNVLISSPNCSSAGADELP